MHRYILLIFIALFLTHVLCFSESLPLKVGLEFPDTNINTIYFSPNFDGSHDTVTMNFLVQSKYPVESWELLIYDKNWSLVKRFPDISEKKENTNTKALINKLLEGKEPPVISASIEWNGFSQDGKVLQEGLYYSLLNVIDIKKNKCSSKTNIIILDITPPAASLSIDDSIFNPNGNGNKNKVRIEQNLSQDFWKAEMRNIDGVVVYRWDWGTNAPKYVEWDGKDQSGSVSPEGTYDYLVFGEDSAGNKTFISINDIKLSLKKYSVFLSLSKDVLSPLGDKSYNHVLIKPYMTETNDIYEWTVKIHNESNNEVFNMIGHGVPPNFLWNGRDSNNIVASNGKYICLLSIEYTNGNRAESQSYPVWINSSAPRLSAVYEPSLFSPDGDGSNDTLFIHLKAEDVSPISDWKLSIFDPDGKPFKIYEGKGRPPEIIKWNGRSDNGELVESASDYGVKASAEDILGNKTNDYDLPPIKIDVLVERTVRGLKIRINNIEFETGKSNFAEKKTAILDRVVQILNKYKEYKLEIEGHTDNVGSEKKNLSLSKLRAIAVYDYLVKKGLLMNRMTTAGYGFKYPISNNATEEGRRKNRRVEFILVK